MVIYHLQKKDSCLESKLYDSVHEINNIYPLDSYKIRRNIFKIVNSDTDKIVMPRPKGRIPRNHHVSLGGTQFPRTPPKNLQGIH